MFRTQLIIHRIQAYKTVNTSSYLCTRRYSSFINLFAENSIISIFRTNSSSSGKYHRHNTTDYCGFCSHVYTRIKMYIQKARTFKIRPVFKNLLLEYNYLIFYYEIFYSFWHFEIREIDISHMCNSWTDQSTQDMSTV